MNSDTPEEVTTLNADQLLGEEKFFNFLLSDEKVMHITGPAGVGKSFLLKFLVTNFIEKFPTLCNLMGVKPKISQYFLTATTNKASEAIEEATGMSSTTIHSLLNLVIKENFSNGKTYITKGRKFELIYNSLIFIDEASMIDYPLKKIIDESTPNCKIVYISDDKQLAPVGEIVSTIYKDVTTKAELSIPVRNSGSQPLMDLCSQLRATVETGVFKPIKEVPGHIEYINKEQFQNLVDTQFINPNVDARIISYTNQIAIKRNNYIRHIRGYGQFYQQGEMLISNSVYESPISGGRLKIEDTVEVITADHTVTQQSVFDNTAKSNISYDVYSVTIKKRDLTVMDLKIPINTEYIRDLSKYFARNKDWIAYFNLKNLPDLRPRDAITAYKAQGSTFDWCIVDLEDISICKHPQQAARLLYVAVSRPKTKLYLYGDLKSAYRGG